MGSFRFIEHTADMGILARGETLAEAFAQAALGLFSSMIDLGQVRELRTHLVEAEASNVESLLVAWLNELIFAFDTEGLALKRFDIKEMTSTNIKAICFGEGFDEARHRVGPAVKAVTYHGLEIKTNGGWQARVFLDI